MSPKKSYKKTGSNGPTRRDLILQAAKDIFKEKGFHAATTAEIAKKAQVAEGTIFRHFNTKKELLFSLLEPLAPLEIGKFLHGITESENRQALRDFLEKHFFFVKENLDLFKILLYESQFHPELREQFIEKVVLKTIKPLEEHFAEGAAQGEYRNVDPAIAARAFLGMLTVFVVWQDILQADTYKEFNENEVIEEVLDIYLNGIKPTSTS